MSTSIFRTIKNIYASGFRRAAWQLQVHNDTKRGWLVGTDDWGNKYYETDAPEEIHMRTRWVEYAEDQKAVRAYPLQKHKMNLTATRGAYVPYNTAKAKCESWDPVVSERL